MSFLYQLVIRSYTAFIYLASVRNKKARLWLKGRRKWDLHLKRALSDFNFKDKELIWFHAASMGEFEQARPLIEQLKEEYNNQIFIVLSFFSPSGYEPKKNYEYADYICYLPPDTARNAKKFIDLLQPSKVFFIKYEFWFNYLSVLKSKNIPLYLVSGIFRKNQVFFKWYGFWHRKNLTAFTHFFLQNKTSAILLKNIGLNNTSVWGDTRVDRVLSIVQNKRKYVEIEQFKSKNLCLVIGSSWPEDEQFLTDFINQHPEYKYIIAPHEITDKHILSLKEQIRLPYHIWAADNKPIDKDVKVLIINTIGHLSNLYYYADLAYVGGAFKTGLHNILEPAVFEIPVIFGPYYDKFQEAKDLIEAQSAVSVSSKESLFRELQLLFTNKKERQIRGENAQRYFEQSKGASAKILKFVK